MDARRQLTWIGAHLAAESLRRMQQAQQAHSAAISFEPPAADAAQTRCLVDGREGIIAVAPLYALEADGETQRRKAALEERLHAYGARDLALWTPPHAQLPQDPDAAAARIAAAAAELPAGGRGEVAFPIQLGIRKTGAEGSYMSVLGGLSAHWARFTGQVLGEYQLDSNQIHRLPEDADRVTQLIDFLVLAANGLRKEGAATTVKADDVWTIQRVDGVEEPIVLAASPDAAMDGRAVRRRMRRALRESGAALESDAQLRIAVLVGLVAQMETETATIALRGMDAALVGVWEYIGLAADGQLRPLLGPSPPLG